MASDLPLFDPFAELAEIRRERARGEQIKPREAERELSQKLSQAPAKVNPEQDQRLDPTFAAFATFAGGPTAHDLAPARVKEEERKDNSIITYTYARNGAAQEHAAASGLSGAAKVARVAKVLPSHCDAIGSGKTGVAKVPGGDLRKWHAALSALSPDRIPCPGYRTEEWPRVLARALAFLDTFGPQAEMLGWTASRLFGVHPTAGIVRVDACGALVLPNAGAVRAITATEVSFGHLTHRPKPGQPAGVPWWEFGR